MVCLRFVPPILYLVSHQGLTLLSVKTNTTETGGKQYGKTLFRDDD